MEASPVAEETSETSPWLWVLLAALAAALAVGLPLVLRARRGAGWRQDLADAETDVAWLARDLVPGLRRTGSAEQAAGGWTVSSARVVSLEDRLTGLEQTAPDEAAAERARTLRDAVRDARARLDQLSGDSSLTALDEVVDGLEAALRTEPAGPEAQGGS